MGELGIMSYTVLDGEDIVLDYLVEEMSVSFSAEGQRIGIAGTFHGVLPYVLLYLVISSIALLVFRMWITPPFNDDNEDMLMRELCSIASDTNDQLRQKMHKFIYLFRKIPVNINHSEASDVDETGYISLEEKLSFYDRCISSLQSTLSNSIVEIFSTEVCSLAIEDGIVMTKCISSILHLQNKFCIARELNERSFHITNRAYRRCADNAKSLSQALDAESELNAATFLYVIYLVALINEFGSGDDSSLFSTLLRRAEERVARYFEEEDCALLKRIRDNEFKLVLEEDMALVATKDKQLEYTGPENNFPLEQLVEGCEYIKHRPSEVAMVKEEALTALTQEWVTYSPHILKTSPSLRQEIRIMEKEAALQLEERRRNRASYFAEARMKARQERLNFDDQISSARLTIASLSAQRDASMTRKVQWAESQLEKLKRLKDEQKQKQRRFGYFSWTLVTFFCVLSYSLASSFLRSGQIFLRSCRHDSFQPSFMSSKGLILSVWRFFVKQANFLCEEFVCDDVNTSTASHWREPLPDSFQAILSKLYDFVGMGVSTFVYYSGMHAWISSVGQPMILQCIFRVITKLASPYVVSRFLDFLGLRILSDWILLLSTVFIAFGPLTSYLQTALVTHVIIPHSILALLLHMFDRHVAWPVSFGCWYKQTVRVDCRGILLYVLYPVVFVGMACVAACYDYMLAVSARLGHIQSMHGFILDVMKFVSAMAYKLFMIGDTCR